MTVREMMMAEVIRKFGFEVEETIEFCRMVENAPENEYWDMCLEVVHMALMDDNYIAICEREN